MNESQDSACQTAPYVWFVLHSSANGSTGTVIFRMPSFGILVPSALRKVCWLKFAVSAVVGRLALCSQWSRLKPTLERTRPPK